MMLRSAAAFPLLLLLLLLRLCWSATSPTYLDSFCSRSGNYTAPSKYGYNLSVLLIRSFHTTGQRSPFYKDTQGDPPDTVYGLFLCRGDVTPKDCQSCVDNATSQILHDCPEDKAAIIWYDQCLVRYSNRSFFSVVELSPSLTMWNTMNVTNQDSFKAVLTEAFQNVTNSAISSSGLYATSNTTLSFQTLFTLVQCTPDLSKPDCRNCLRAAVAELWTYAGGKAGGRALLPSCNIRYELYRFLDDPTAQAPSPNSTYGTIDDRFVSKRTMPVGWIIASIIAGACVVLIFVGLYICIKRQIKTKEERADSQEVQLLDLGNGIGGGISNDDFQGEKPLSSQDFLLMQLKVICTATNNFSDESKLGQGGFGPVYKGILADGREIAVKRLSRTSGQGFIELKNEVTLIARLQHRNLVRLLGCCLEEHEKLLIYEYMPNKSLDFFLFDPSMSKSLDWKRRFSIIYGIARGLLYLHEDSRLRIIHRDLKASNILLDHEMNPKISDFGLARIFDVNQDEASTNRVVGTYGYMAPEYAMGGFFSVKSDVFSFGVLLLEIVSGRKNNSFHLHKHGESLLTFTWKLWNNEQALDLIDGSIRELYDAVQVLKCIHIGLLCVQEDPADRPTMSDVISLIKGDRAMLHEPSPPAFFIGKPLVNELNAGKPVNEPSTVNEVTLSDISPR